MVIFSHRSWRLEDSWLKFVRYAFLRAWPAVLGLALIWTILATSLVRIADALDGESKPYLLISLPLFIFLAGSTFAFFRSVFALARAGYAGYFLGPGADSLQILWSTAATVLCFVTGPIVPAGVAYLFWLNAGDLEWIDVVILWELGFAAVAYWTLALMAVNERGTLRDANPVALIRLAVRLRWRARLVVAMVSVGFVAAFHLTLDAFELAHEGALGVTIIGLSAYGGLSWIVFLLRWLGVSQHP